MRSSAGSRPSSIKRPLRSAAAIGVAALVMAAGCGGGGLSSAQRDRLEARIADARKAADARDGDGARRALASFRASVRSARDAGAISNDDAQRLLTGALQAQSRVSAEITPEPNPAPTPVATATATPAPPTPKPGKKPKGKPHGKGHGKGDD